MSDHTQEPWRVHTPRQSVLVMNHEGYVLAEFMQFGDDPRPANARRACACVNACAGWTTEQLEEWAADRESPLLINQINDREDELAALRTQVADLRAALEGLMADESNECDCPPEENCPNEIARRVLAATQPQEVQS